ncbi:PASTA domain-containing protein [Nocardia sp. NPDC050710]|uniref:PASTA domain-containing protein n=1 Tax=Nocardia sp. NPDC050710 TaxID=3157220 RepID=UPI003409AB95
MRECSNCGQPNAENAEFCVNPQCRTYLGWATTAMADPSRPPTANVPPTASAGVRPGPPKHPSGPPGPGPGPAPGQRFGVRVTMEPTELSVDPGAAVVATVTVHNTGTRVEEFELGVAGPLRPYAHLEPAVLRVFPDTQATAVVRFAPPRDAQVRAGRAPFVLGARSRVNARVEDRVSGTLTVGAFTELKAALQPEASRGRKPARHTVVTTNLGNVPLGVQIVLADRAGALTFEPPQAVTTLAPGASVETPVLVGGARKWFGRTESHAFTAQANPADGAPPIGLNGVRNQVPVLPWWIPTAVAVMLALTLAVIALLPKHKDTVPGTSGMIQLVAEQTLQNAGYRPVVVQRADPNVPVGQVIETKPAGGTELKDGEPVQLFISLGPCEGGECLVEVPNVEGLKLADAQVALEAAEFTVRTFEAQNPAIAKGMVISSNPAAGEKKERGSEVVLAISTGPAPTTTPTTPPVAGGGGGENGGGGGGGGGDKGGAAQVEVPDVAGKSKAEATDKITAAGLTVEVVEQSHGTIATGKVISTDPAAKTKVDKGSAVKVTVSTGPPPIEVPDVTKKPKAEAIAALTALGFKTKVVEQPDTKIADGAVISTTPAAKAKAPKDTEITLMISQGPPCKPGFVFRLATPTDHVCVTQARADRAKTENTQGPSRISTTDHTYGPDTCIQGYVWREAVKDDHVCVTPQSRSDAAADNAADKDRHAK